jgi:hypothetical protein
MNTSNVQPTEGNITFARHAISHNADGPVTPFVLISRACELRDVSNEVAANALYEELRARGWVCDENERVEVDALRDEVAYLRRIAQAYKETAEARA